MATSKKKASKPRPLAYYFIEDAGDGSAYARFFTTQEKMDEAMSKGNREQGVGILGEPTTLDASDFDVPDD